MKKSLQLLMILAISVAVSLAGTTLVTAQAVAAAPSKAKPKADKRQTVAVVYFDYTGKDPELFGLKKGLASMLLSELSDVDAVRFVERERIQAIMDELKLSSSKAMDKKTAARIGKVLGARYLIMGTYFGLLGKLRIDARLVEVETGRVVKSVGATGKPDDFMELVDALKSKLGLALEGLLPMEFSKRKAVKIARNKAKRPKKKRAKVNKKLALRFSAALDAKDRGDKVVAKKELTAIVAAEPSFTLASAELAKVR